MNEQVNVIPVNADKLNGKNENQLDVDKVDGQDSSQLGASPDTVSIVEDSNGNLKAVRVKDQIGQFETDIADWTKFDNSGGNVSTNDRVSDSGAPQGGYVYRQYRSGTGGTDGWFGIKNTFDLTNVDKLIAQVKPDNGSVSLGCRIYVGGNAEYTSTGNSSNYNAVEIDVSGYSGDTEIRVQTHNDANNTSYSGVFFDDLLLVKSIPKIATSSSGGV